MPSIFELVPAFRRNKVRLSIPDTSRVNNLGQPTAINLLEIEAMIEETASYTSTLTESPIEDGSTIADHVTIQPREIVLNCIITNHPLTLQSTLIGNVAGLVGGIIGRSSRNNIASAIGTGGLATIAAKISNTITNDGGRVTNAIQKLQAAWEGAALITVEGGLTTYSNMLITKIDMKRNKDTSNTLPFTITMREVRIVRSKTITLPKQVITKARQRTAAPTTDNGRQPTNGPTAEQTSKYVENRSKLATFSDFVKGSGGGRSR